ncbi:MAG: hypothetical protein KIT43_04605 [Bauldia sp.]|nr:hypothetical protein [Bauldia sp.]MCW5717963.1 hypothetical protein [Bauldia sp.]
MADDLRSELRLTLSLALTMVPRGTRREYSEKLLIRSDPAKDAITETLLAALLERFRLESLPRAETVRPVSGPTPAPLAATP